MGAFALGCAISGRRGVGLLTAVFVVLIGNLAGLREILSRRVVNFDYFWATSRVIKDTINEYPLWSFLFADLHAHVLVIPFSLSFLALAVWWVRRAELAVPLRSWVLFALIGVRARRDHGDERLELADVHPVLAVSRRHRAVVAPAGRARPHHAGGAAGSDCGGRPGDAPSIPGDVQQRRCQARDRRGGDDELGPDRARRLGDADPAARSHPAHRRRRRARVRVLPAVLARLHPPPRNIGLEEQSYADFWDFGNIFGLFLFVAIPFVFALWRRTLQGPARQRLGRGRVLAMWVVATVIFACWVLSIPAVAHLLPASLGVQGSLRLGLAVMAVLSFSVALQRTLTSSQRIAAIMLSFAFAIIAGTDVIYVWDRMNTIFKFYLEAWSLLAAATAVAIVDLWQGVIRSRALRRAWQLGTIVLLCPGRCSRPRPACGPWRTPIASIRRGRPSTAPPTCRTIRRTIAPRTNG